MTLTDYLIEKCQHDLSLLKSEMTNREHVILIDEAANKLQQVKYDRQGER